MKAAGGNSVGHDKPPVTVFRPGKGKIKLKGARTHNQKKISLKQSPFDVRDYYRNLRLSPHPFCARGEAVLSDLRPNYSPYFAGRDFEHHIGDCYYPCHASQENLW